MKMKTLKRLGVISVLAAATFFAGCAGGPAPVAEEQLRQQEEAREAKAPEVEKTASTSGIVKPPEAIDAAPPTTAKYWSEALMADEDRDYPAALENVVKVRQANPGYPGARELETKLRYRLGDAKAGLPFLAEMVRNGEGGEAAINTYAKWAVESGQGKTALNVLKKLAFGVNSAAPTANPALVAALGWLYQVEGDQQQALLFFNLLAEGRPLATKFAPFHARARFETGDYEGVRELFKRYPTSVQMQLLMADVNRLQGRASAAENGYLQVLEGNHANYWAKVSLGILKLSQGDAEGARTLLEEGAAARPDKPEAWCNLGLALRALGEHDRALETYEKALEVAPEHPQTLKNIGILWEKYFGEPAQGVQYYERYLKVVGIDEEVQRWNKAAKRLAGSSK